MSATETAVLKVLSDMMEPVDVGEVASLILLNLLAAFDTVDHDMLCRQLQTTCGMGGPVIDLTAWLWYYLQGRTQHVRHGSSMLSSAKLILCRSAGIGHARSDFGSDVHCRPGGLGGEARSPFAPLR